MNEWCIVQGILAPLLSGGPPLRKPQKHQTATARVRRAKSITYSTRSFIQLLSGVNTLPTTTGAITRAKGCDSDSDKTWNCVMDSIRAPHCSLWEISKGQIWETTTSSTKHTLFLKLKGIFSLCRHVSGKCYRTQTITGKHSLCFESEAAIVEANSELLI